MKLKPASIRSKARRHGYSEVASYGPYVLSFKHHHKLGCGGWRKKYGAVKVDVDFLKGEVVTHLNHHTSGHTQLARDVFSHNELEKILKNPRVHTNRGRHVGHLRGDDDEDFGYRSGYGSGDSYSPRNNYFSDDGYNCSPRNHYLSDDSYSPRSQSSMDAEFQSRASRSRERSSRGKGRSDSRKDQRRGDSRVRRGRNRENSSRRRNRSRSRERARRGSSRVRSRSRSRNRSPRDRRGRRSSSRKRSRSPGELSSDSSITSNCSREARSGSRSAGLTISVREEISASVSSSVLPTSSASTSGLAPASRLDHLGHNTGRSSMSVSPPPSSRLVPPAQPQEVSSNPFTSEERTPEISKPVDSSIEWKWPNFFLKQSKLNSTPLISHPVAMAQLPLQATSTNAFQEDPEIRKPANFSMNWEWRKTKPLLRKSPLDSLSIVNQPDVQSQLPLQETSTKALQKGSIIPEERKPANRYSNVDWMMPNSSLKSSPLMRKENSDFRKSSISKSTKIHASQAEPFIPEKRTLEIRKPDNSSNNSEWTKPIAPLKRSPPASPPRKRTKSSSRSPERMQISPDPPLQSPRHPTCEKKTQRDSEEIGDAEVKKELPPTIYSRFKNVVADAIQKIWSIFQ